MTAKNTVMNFIFLLHLFFAGYVNADYEVECTGINVKTGSEIIGKCNNGDFNGRDTKTQSTVSGHCDNGGDFNAYDNKTKEFIYGECEFELLEQ